MLTVIATKTKETKQYVRYDYNGGTDGGIVIAYYPKAKMPPGPAPETMPVTIGQEEPRAP